jgi:hypothetical protein
VALLNRDNDLEFIDLGRSTSSSATSLAMLILNQLRLYDYLVDVVSPRFLTRSRHWPEGCKEWSTKAIRDTFFASPHFPRVLNVEVIKEAIAKGISSGLLAYVGKKVEGEYKPFYYKKSLLAEDVEISEDMFIITPETADDYLETKERILTAISIDSPEFSVTNGEKLTFTLSALDQDGEEIKRNVKWEASGGAINQDGVFTVAEKDGSDFEVKATDGKQTAWGKITILSKHPESGELPQPAEEPKAKPVTRLSWSGELGEPQWELFRTTVITVFAGEHTLKVRASLEISKDSGVTQENIARMKTALRELGLSDDVQIKR